MKRLPAAARQAIFLGATEPRAARPRFAAAEPTSVSQGQLAVSTVGTLLLFSRGAKHDLKRAPRTLVFDESSGGLIMKTWYTVALSMIAGAAAIQGLHAQAKPKAYLVTESEILDRAAVESYSAVLGPAMQAAGGHFIGRGTGPTEKITAVVGNPPKRFGVSEFGSAY